MRLVLIALGTIAGSIDPFRMLKPQVVMNLLLQFGVGMDVVSDGGLSRKSQFVVGFH